MENKINIAELLKDCPKGMELDCTIWENVTFEEVVTVKGFDDKKRVKIILSTRYSDGMKDEIILTEFGTYTDDETAKCVIFPKGKTTWDEFTPPCQFKDGDILTNKNRNIFIYKGPMFYNKLLTDFYCGYRIFDEKFIPKLPNDKHFGDISECRLATEEEKAKLFQVIKDNGYRWDEESKTLETLPKFKDGDILANDDTVFIYNGMEELSPSPCYYVYVIADNNGFFAIDTSTKKYGTRIATKEEKNKLFEAIKNNGYRWDEETKKLNKLIEPRFTIGDTIKSEKWQATRKIQGYVAGVGYFTTINDWVRIDEQDNWELVKDTTPIFKIGDRIKKKDGIDYRLRTIVSINNNHYIIKTPDWFDNCYITDKLPFDCQNEYELIYNDKFDISTLIPFESRVLVRDTEEEKWKSAIWGYYDVDHIEGYPYETVGGNCFCFCIPYEKNEHLHGTTNDCDDFYKTWES